MFDRLLKIKSHQASETLVLPQFSRQIGWSQNGRSRYQCRGRFGTFLQGRYCSLASGQM